MSGEPGAILQSNYYIIKYTAGISVSPAIPPNWDWEKDGDYTARFFNEENRFFSKKLNDIKSELDSLINDLIRNSNLPILKYDSNNPRCQTINFLVNDLQPLEIRLTVSEELSAEIVQTIIDQIKPLFEDERET